MLKITHCGYCRTKLRVNDTKSFRCGACGRINTYVEFEEEFERKATPINGYLGRGYKVRKAEFHRKLIK